MSDISRNDAVVLLVTPGNYVLAYYGPKDLQYVKGLVNNNYVVGHRMMLQTGWALLDQNSQYAHPVHRNQKWDMLEKHFYVPATARIVPIGDHFALKSPANGRYLDEDGEFTLVESKKRDAHVFGDEGQANSFMHQHGLIEA